MSVMWGFKSQVVFNEAKAVHTSYPIDIICVQARSREAVVQQQK